MHKILLYSPDVIGHPRVYCRVIADALMDADCELVVAMGFTDAVGLDQSPDLWPLKSRARTTLLDTRTFSNVALPNLKAEELLKLQTAHNIDVTLFIEGDKSNQEFTRIASGEAPRLHGRNIAIFANTAEWFPGEDSFTGERKTVVAPTLRTTLGNVKRAFFNRNQRPKYFYEQIIIGAGVLDEVWVKDERLSSWHGPPVYWMPEISRPPATDETAEETAEFRVRQSELDCFLAINVGREPVLYFGDAAYYKGYDLFLEFIAANPFTCAIHPGRTFNQHERSHFRSDVDALRTRLRAEGRLYETNAYVHTQRLKALFFGVIRVYITTHRLALSSSTMIQALEFGKPVLVPDRGLIGYRARINQVGGVYRYEDMEDLGRRAEALWHSDLGHFADPIARLYARFSDDAIRTFFTTRLLKP